jgi:hypothetical protein
MPNNGYVFTNWSAGTPFNPNAAAVVTTTSLTGADTITAHFAFNTTVAEDPGQDPVVGVYPSVFSEQSLISFNLPVASRVGIRIFSADGKPVAEIAKPGDNFLPGQHSIRLDLHASSLAAGVYLVDFMAGNYHKTIRIYYAPVK